MPRGAASNRHWSRPSRACGTGVLVMAGSSGVLDVGRADALARAGATALALRWFGGEGQPSLPRRVPLETVVEALDLLSPECDRLGILGLSYGAEAALLAAVRDRRVDVVIGLAPTDVAWEGASAEAGDPSVSKWTWQGGDVPFVPLDHDWVPPSQPPAFVDLYRRSRQRAGAAVLAAATIPAEQIRGDVVLVAGGDDQVWPSSDAAHVIAARRRSRGLETTVVVDAHAGHPVLLPGEVTRDTRRAYRVGGDPDGPRRLGLRAWPAIRSALRLSGPPDARGPRLRP